MQLLLLLVVGLQVAGSPAVTINNTGRVPAAQNPATQQDQINQRGPKKAVTTVNTPRTQKPAATTQTRPASKTVSAAVNNIPGPFPTDLTVISSIPTNRAAINNFSAAGSAFIDFRIYPLLALLLLA
ncbi:hypothetical protein HDV03_005304 [Kappamyces sp. JEL0829]|nr:hypothetical protein HDV03_005304 [Kappamyces sp. JEL0829]